MALISLAFVALLLPAALSHPQPAGGEGFDLGLAAAAAEEKRDGQLEPRAITTSTIVVTTPTTPATKTTTSSSSSPRTTTTTTTTTSVVVAVSTTRSKCPSPPPTVTPIRCKRGLVISGSYADALVKAFSNSPKICWMENWYSAPFKNLAASIKFIPQDYGKDSNLDGTWTRNAETAITVNNATHFLGFGEPHTDGHLHMEPQEAVNLWLKDLEPYACRGVKLGAPSIVQNGRPWLTDFINKCEQAGCTIGFLSCHWYWRADQFEDFKSNVLQCIQLANGKYPVWVTNFQASGDSLAQTAFLDKAVPWLESLSQVQQYGYVAIDKDNGFLGPNQQGLSDLGYHYANM